MFKIDIHTHIIPSNLNHVMANFSDPRFLRINFGDEDITILCNYNMVLLINKNII